jgi:hypothetical protein
MALLLVQHGISETKDVDPERGLSGQGRVETKRIAQVANGYANELIDEVNHPPSTGKVHSILKNQILFQWERQQHKVTKIMKDVPLFIDYLSLSIHSAEKTGNFQDQKTLYGHLQDTVYKKSELYPKFKWVIDYFSEVCHFHLPLAGKHQGHYQEFIDSLEKH